MRTVKDLRDLINVSRLTYRESDDENENNEYLDQNQDEFNYDTIMSMNNRLTKNSYLNKSSSATNGNTISNSNHIPVTKHSFNFMTPNISKATPIASSSLLSNKNRIEFPVRNSLLNSKEALLDRNSIPKLSLSNFKKPLPPLKNNKSNSPTDSALVPSDNDDDVNNENENNEPQMKAIKNTDKNFKMSIEPLKASEDDNNDDKHKKLLKNETQSNAGNFDYILVYVDASVVSEWLNRANRSLKKMYKWAKDNKDSYDTFEVNNSSNLKNQNKLLKYESFISFCNFWLGGGTVVDDDPSDSKRINSSSLLNKKNVFSDKQRRSLIELEYSIICDEVVQAFQIGIDSQKISLQDINKLIRAVFKEYPLQILSFRGAYLILNMIDILSSNRQDEEYKNLLSDVKCRTVNKQYAQWLLSIRSFAIINLCWSIIKFYRKTVKSKKEYEAVTSRILSAHTSRMDKEMDNIGNNIDRVSSSRIIAELDGRLSSLTIANEINESSRSSSSSASSINSEYSSESSTNRGSAKSSSLSLKLGKNHKKSKNEDHDHTNIIMTPTLVKYDLYLQAVYKNDYPDVLHYLITTQKCDVLKTDEHGRNLIFLAVMNEKPKILRYLIKRWPCIDINAECDSGNTSLHAAVNKGKLELVEIILESLSNTFTEKNNSILLDVNKINKKCMNATALHLAVWNDYTDIALRLIQANADPYLKMNGISNAFDLARENSNEILYDLLSEFYNSTKGNADKT